MFTSKKMKPDHHPTVEQKVTPTNLLYKDNGLTSSLVARVARMPRVLQAPVRQRSLMVANKANHVLFHSTRKQHHTNK
jgi:hypothetical protein